jgi:hypothetical protein
LDMSCRLIYWRYLVGWFISVYYTWWLCLVTILNSEFNISKGHPCTGTEAPYRPYGP